jgi:glucosamine-6-phosphate deaminase
LLLVVVPGALVELDGFLKGRHPLGQRLTALMISKGIADSAVPMSLLADHPNVQFNYYRGGLGSCAVEMH